MQPRRFFSQKAKMVGRSEERMPVSDSDMTVAAYRPGLGRLVKDQLTQYRDSALSAMNGSPPIG